MTQRTSNIVAGPGGDGEADGSATTIAFDDGVLVDRCRKGDMQAFAALAAKYQHRVYNLVLRMCQRPADAEELAQETFLRALENLHQFRGQSCFYTWLFRIAANLAISQRRRGGRIRFQSISESPGGDDDAETLAHRLPQRREDAPEKGLHRDDCNRRLTEALESLDEEFRLVVLLRDVEDMDYAQIAAVIDLPIGTVKSRLHRARSVLRDKLADLLE